MGKFVDGRVDAKYGDVKANLDSDTGENIFAQNHNISFGSAEDRQKSTDRIAKHRQDKKLNNTGNFGYLEGTINGQAVDDRMWRSTSLESAE